VRYIVVEWMEKKPDDREVYRQVAKVLGEIGLARSEFKLLNGVIACDRKWVDKVRGALALRWQFRVKKISGTLKGATK